MNEKNSPNFTIGFLIGLLLCVALWYWQKSTAAEDGALDLMDRYASMEKRMRNVVTDLTSAVSLPTSTPTDQPSFDFQEIKGIGPIFNERLHEVGINSLNRLTAISVDTLAELLDIGEGRAQSILNEAKSLSKS